MGRKRVNPFLSQSDHLNYEHPTRYNIRKRMTMNSEHLAFGASTSYPHSTTEVSLTSNMEIRSTTDTPLNILYLDLGDCKYCCQYCGAYFWFNERSNNRSPPKYNYVVKKVKSNYLY